MRVIAVVGNRSFRGWKILSGAAGNVLAYPRHAVTLIIDKGRRLAITTARALDHLDSVSRAANLVEREEANPIPTITIPAITQLQTEDIAWLVVDHLTTATAEQVVIPAGRKGELRPGGID